MKLDSQVIWADRGRLVGFTDLPIHPQVTEYLPWGRNTLEGWVPLTSTSVLRDETRKPLTTSIEVRKRKGIKS